VHNGNTFLHYDFLARLHFRFIALIALDLFQNYAHSYIYICVGSPNLILVIFACSYRVSLVISEMEMKICEIYTVNYGKFV
jgi:hypothetical protein